MAMLNSAPREGTAERADYDYRSAERDANLAAWQRQFNARGTRPMTDTMRVTSWVRDPATGRRTRQIHVVDFQRLLTRYRSERARQDPEWYWFNLTNEEQLALTQTGTLTRAETNAQLGYYRGGNTGGKMRDKRVGEWELNGYPDDWTVAYPEA